MNKNDYLLKNKDKRSNIISLTDSAKYKILNLIKDNPNFIGLRLSLKKSGCAGFSFSLDKITNIKNYDSKVYEYKKIKIFVSSKEIPFIDGTILDYVKEGLNYSFKFNNPKANYYCGCGSSFGLK